MPSSTDTPQATVATASSAGARLTFNASTSPLLQLPGELGNRINEYAFATNTGIKYVAGPRPYFVPRGGSTTELNQLKYTCRQLYEETAGLEVQVNKVQFSGQSNDSGPAKLFLEFIASCAPKKADWFRETTT